MIKTRILYFSITITFGVLALLTRSGIDLPALIVSYGGDTLWAVMCYFLICTVLPENTRFTNLLLALLLSYSVETSQLYQAEWIKAIRATELGGLALGHGFKISDLVCYTLGNFLGFLFDVVVRNRLVKRAGLRLSS